MNTDQPPTPIEMDENASSEPEDPEFVIWRTYNSQLQKDEEVNDATANT